MVECESICGLRTGLIVAKKDAYGVEMSMNKRETTACQYNCFIVNDINNFILKQ